MNDNNSGREWKMRKFQVVQTGLQFFKKAEKSALQARYKTPKEGSEK